MQNQSIKQNSESEQKEINAETIMTTVNNSFDGLRKIILENPKVVLGVAFGVGLLVGFMAGGKKEQKSDADHK